MRLLEEVVGPRRAVEELSDRDKDLARSTQDACERAMLALLRRVTERTGSRRLCPSRLIDKPEKSINVNCRFADDGKLTEVRGTARERSRRMVRT